MRKYSKISLNDKRLFKVAVMSTMSSGKSTLINALAGQELLPSINRACTARTLSLLDNDLCETTVGHILYEDHTFERVEGCSLETVRQFNDRAGKPISDIIIECNIQGIHNAKTALLLVDTPGINNHLNRKHGDTAEAFLQTMESGLILFVLNATQLTTYDTEEFLRKVHSQIAEHPELQILFALNRIDEIDRTREPLDSFMRAAADFVKSVSYPSPVIIPVSAKAALLFRKALSGAPLTENECDDFSVFYKKFTPMENGDFDYRDFLWDEELRNRADVEIDGRTYSPWQLQRALEQTGLPTLERYIEIAMLRTAGGTPPKVQKVAEKNSVLSQSEPSYVGLWKSLFAPSVTKGTGAPQFTSSKLNSSGITPPKLKMSTKKNKKAGGRQE